MSTDYFIAIFFHTSRVDALIHEYVGGGFPLALHVIDAVSPSLISTFVSRASISGAVYT